MGLSQYLSYLLRHHPESIGLNMNEHGYVLVKQLIDNINKKAKYTINKNLLDDIVRKDNEQRYKYSEDGLYIKACQRHSMSCVTPELIYITPPDILYHGITSSAYKKILKSGYISKMKRHAVHTQQDINKAWLSAIRWYLTPIVLEIDAKAMVNDGYLFGVSDNNVWCVDQVLVQYIRNVIYED